MEMRLHVRAAPKKYAYLLDLTAVVIKVSFGYLSYLKEYAL